MRKRAPRLRRPRRAKNEVPFIRGHKLVVPNHPTEFCAVPWFPLILRVLNPVTTITQAELYTAFTQQLPGLSFQGSALNVRLLSVRVWGPIPVTGAALRMTVNDIFDDTVGQSAGNGILEVVENYGDQVNRARVGYQWSTAQQQKSIFVLTGGTDAIITLAGAGNTSVAYFKVLWRPRPVGTRGPNDIDENERFSEQVGRLTIK